FAQPSVPNARPSPIVPKRPPDPVPEIPSDQKPEGDNVQWIPGYWSWDGDRNDFIWVSGIWRIPPPNRKWVPGHWAEAQGGWQWVAGLWASAVQNTIEYQPPPPDSLDYGPSMPAPDDSSIYVPGCWMFRDTRYLWRPGFWTAGHPGWVW